MKHVLALLGTIYAASFADAVFPNLSQKTSTSSDVRVIGGHDANLTEFPYVVHVTIDKKGTRVLCGGAILSPLWVITSGQCNLPNNDFMSGWITAGVHTLDKDDDQHVAITKSYLHPKFHYNVEKGEIANDIQLLELNWELTFNQIVQPIRLPEKSQKFDEGWLSGWGIYMRPNAVPSALQSLKMPIVTRKECLELLSHFKPKDRLTFDKTMICAAPPTGTEQTCNGDTGGPLAFDGYLIGIVSWSPDCQSYKLGAPTIFTEVNQYLSFIKKHVGDI